MRNRGERLRRNDFDRYRIGSLSKGLAVLSIVANAKQPVSATVVAQYADLSTVTAYRLLTTLEAEGYIAQDAFTKRYSLSTKVLGLGFAYLNSLSYLERATPFLERLAQRTGEATSMAVLDQTEIVYVARVASRSLLSINLHVGSRLPAFYGAMGYVLLAALDETESNRRLASTTFRPPTRKGPQTRPAFVKNLSLVRRKGYAINDQFLEVGLRSAAAPVRDQTSAVIAAINIAVPAAAVSKRELVRSFAPSLIETARDISGMLGYGHGEWLAAKDAALKGA